jgi:hypothetical protein
MIAGKLCKKQLLEAFTALQGMEQKNSAFDGKPS